MSSQGMLMLVCRPLSEQWTAVCCYLELREWPPDQFLDYLFFVSHQALFESTWQDDLLLYDIRQHILLSVIPFSLSINTFPLFSFCLLVLLFRPGEFFTFLVIFAAWPVIMLWSPHLSYLVLSFPLFFISGQGCFSSIHGLVTAFLSLSLSSLRPSMPFHHQVQLTNLDGVNTISFSKGFLEHWAYQLIVGFFLVLLSPSFSPRRIQSMEEETYHFTWTWDDWATKGPTAGHGNTALVLRRRLGSGRQVALYRGPTERKM